MGPENLRLKQGGGDFKPKVDGTGVNLKLKCMGPGDLYLKVKIGEGEILV